MSGHIGRIAKSGVASVLSLAALAALPSTAGAGDRGDRYDRGSRYSRDDWRRDNLRHESRGGTRVDIDIRTGPTWERVPAPPVVLEERVWVEPVYRTVCDRVWVPAAYRTVIDKVWVEPVIERRIDRVWVPDRYEWRDVVRYDECGRRICRRERVLVERGHFGSRPCDVVVAPGHYKECPRQELVCDGRWETVERQELVSAGHWETRRVAAAPRYEERSTARIDLTIPVRW
jgi:hypothetical protein